MGQEGSHSSSLERLDGDEPAGVGLELPKPLRVQSIWEVVGCRELEGFPLSPWWILEGLRGETEREGQHQTWLMLPIQRKF